MSHNVHYQIVDYKESSYAGPITPSVILPGGGGTGAAMTAPPIASAPAPATTAAQMPAAPPGNATASKQHGHGGPNVRKGTEVSITQTRTSDETVEAQNTSGMMKDYNTITMDIPGKMFSSENPGYKLVVWLPRRSASRHYTERKYATTVTANGPAEVFRVDVAGELESQSMEEKREEGESYTSLNDQVRDVIKKLTELSITANTGMSSDIVSSYMVQGKHWDFKPAQEAVIQEVNWTRVASKMEHHAAGILFKEQGPGDPMSRSSKKLKSIKYQRAGVKAGEEDYQIIIEPSVSSLQVSDQMHLEGALLVKKPLEEDDPFIVNSVLSSVYSRVGGEVGSPAVGSHIGVELHDLQIMWALVNLSSLYPMYVSEARRMQGVSRDGFGQEELASFESADSLVRDLDEIDSADSQLSLGEILGAVGSLMCTHFTPLNRGGFWKLNIDSTKRISYQLPSVFVALARQQFQSKLRNHQVFNSGTSLAVSAVALPLGSRGVGVENEQSQAVMVQFGVRYYLPQFGFCYAPLGKDVSL